MLNALNRLIMNLIKIQPIIKGQNNSKSNRRKKKKNSKWLIRIMNQIRTAILLRIKNIISMITQF